MHIKDNQLRAYLDHELTHSEAQQTGEHLEGCAECQTRLEQLRQAEALTRARIERLAPSTQESPRPAHEAYARLMSNRSPLTSPKAREIPMLKRKTFWTALAVLTALVLVFTMTPARAWAGTFLNLFRVQSVQVITFDPALVDSLHNQMEGNSAAFKQVFQEDLEINRHGEPRAVASVEEAAAAVGFTPRMPSALENANLMIEPGMDAVLTINQPKLQELLNLSGVDYMLPESLDGQVVTFEVPDAVVVSSGCVKPDPSSEPDAPLMGCQTLAQMPSPSVNAPDEMDVPRMGQAVFQMLGYTPEEAQALSQRIDWTSTLVLPVPANEDVTYREVQVDDVTGTMLMEEGAAVLIWVKNDMLYAVRSPSGPDKALAIARSLE